MTKIKLCGMRRAADIEVVNQILPEYIGFIFARDKRRYLAPEQAAKLKAMLNPNIKAVGVFIQEKPQAIAQLLAQGIIDLAQLHGNEDEAYIRELRQLTDKPLIQAFKVVTTQDLVRATKSTADYILLDSGTGTGQTFNWQLLQDMHRPYFLAGGLNLANIAYALEHLQPFAVDVSSGIETNGYKDAAKMTAFVDIVRERTKNHD